MSLEQGYTLSLTYCAFGMELVCTDLQNRNNRQTKGHINWKLVIELSISNKSTFCHLWASFTLMRSFLIFELLFSFNWARASRGINLRCIFFHWKFCIIEHFSFPLLNYIVSNWIWKKLRYLNLNLDILFVEKEEKSSVHSFLISSFLKILATNANCLGGKAMLIPDHEKSLEQLPIFTL